MPSLIHVCKVKNLSPAWQGMVTWDINCEIGLFISVSFMNVILQFKQLQRQKVWIHNYVQPSSCIHAHCNFGLVGHGLIGNNYAHELRSIFACYTDYIALLCTKTCHIVDSVNLQYPIKLGSDLLQTAAVLGSASDSTFSVNIVKLVSRIQGTNIFQSTVIE